MMKSSFGQFSQFDHLTVEFSGTSKRGFTLNLNRGRTICTKSGMFGQSFSSTQQIGEELVKMATAAYTPVIKSIPLSTT
jgi:hypothetical protein